MKQVIFCLIGISIIFGTSFSFAQQESQSPSVGTGKAVIEAEKEKGIRLSEKAKKTIGIKTIKLDKTLQIPTAALIHERGESGVYVKTGEWFKYIEVEVARSSASTVKIESTKVRPGDEIVVADVALLRLAELNLSNTGGDND